MAGISLSALVGMSAACRTHCLPCDSGVDRHCAVFTLAGNSLS